MRRTPRSVTALLPLLLFAPVPAAPLALSGCLGCDNSLVFGLSVKVIDGITDEAIPNATVTLIDGDYVEVLDEASMLDGAYLGAGERAGSYDIEVVAAGYAPAHLADIEVEEDRCHVETRKLRVPLAPASRSD